MIRAVFASSRIVVVISLTLLSVARLTGQSQPPVSDRSEPVTTFKASTRMVTLEVVAKDHNGNHVTGLKASDFQVFEQSRSRGKQKYQENIAAFREVRMADLASQLRSKLQVPTGIYTNVITLPQEPVPPTIFLVDGLNTDIKDQMQVHIQLLKMLRSLPNNVPVAVFLFGHKLRMVQDFTSDPKLLQAALGDVKSLQGQNVAKLDPTEDPDSMPAKLDSFRGMLPPELVAAVEHFEREHYVGDMDQRVRETIEALTTLARRMAGYPGRKNLLWISTGFPISVNDADNIPRDYWLPLKRMASALSEAKIAVYPINPAGVQGFSLFQAGTRLRNNSVLLETNMRNGEQDTMEVIAAGTGGRVCTGDNDLGDCVQKAMDDSSSFYEIAYYPDSQDWNGEYRKVILKSRAGLHLAYRQGYYATSEGSQDEKTELRQAACDDYLDATSIFIAATRLPAASPDQLKFYMTINTSALTAPETNKAGRDLHFIIAACSFDREGRAQQLMSENIHHEFTKAEYQGLLQNGLPHIVSIPGPQPAAVRLLVKDIPSGRLGSVGIKLESGAPVAAIAPATSGQTSTAPH